MFNKALKVINKTLVIMLVLAFTLVGVNISFPKYADIVAYAENGNSLQSADPSPAATEPGPSPSITATPETSSSPAVKQEPSPSPTPTNGDSAQSPSTQQGQDTVQTLPITIQSITDSDGYLTDEGLQSLQSLPYDPLKYNVDCDNSDGSKSIKAYSHPVKFKDKDGVYKDIDNNIIANDKDITKYKYKNAASDVQILLAEDLTQDSAIQMNYQNYSIGFKPLNLLKGNDNKKLASLNFIDANNPNKIDKENNKSKKYKSVNYSKTFNNNSDLQITPTSNGVKEDIILSQKPKEKEFSYEINTSNVVPLLRRDGNVYLVDLNKNVIVAVIASPIMHDSSEGWEYSEDISVKLIRISDNKYLYTMIPDKSYLEKAVYPVVIDPSVQTEDLGIGDTYVKSGYSGNYCAGEHIIVGRNSSGNKYRSLIKIFADELTYLRNTIGSTPISSVHFCAYQDYDGPSYPWIECHEIGQSWALNTVTYSNQPTFFDWCNATQVQDIDWYSWDATDCVKDWIYGNTNECGMPTYGLLLKIENESLNQYKTFRSQQYDGSNKDYFDIRYYPQNLTVTGSASGNAVNSGTGYVNLSWNTVPEAYRYRVFVFDGRYFDQVYWGTATNWTSQGKNIWPTASEITSGRYFMHTDNLGTELATDPISVYNNAGQGYTSHNYRIQVTAYDLYDTYPMCTVEYDATLPDRISPNKPNAPTATVTPGGYGSGVYSTVEVSYSNVSDLPGSPWSTSVSYQLYMSTNGGSYSLRSESASNNKFTLRNLPDNTVYSFKIRAVDLAGNYSESNITTGSSYDRTAPTEPTTLTASPDASTNWVNSSTPNAATPTITWSGITDPNSGLTGGSSKAQYKIDNGAWNNIPINNGIASGSYQLPIGILTSGTHTIKVRGMDNAGNASDTITKSVTYLVDIDGPTAPTVTAAWTNNTSLTLAWSGITDVGSSLYKAQYGIGAADDPVGNVTFTDIPSEYGVSQSNTEHVFIIDMSDYDDGEYKVYVRGIDVASNNGATGYASYKKDTEGPAAPTVSLDLTTWTNVTAVTVTWSGNNDNLNSVTSAQYAIGTENQLPSDLTFENIDTQYGITESNSQNPFILNMSSHTDGIYKIWIRGIDSLGNVGTATSAEYKKDVDNPSTPAVTLSTPGETNVTNPVVYWKDISDAGSGLQKVQIGQSAENESADNVIFTDIDSATYGLDESIVENPLSVDFSNSTTYPDGTYWVWIKAWDNVGHTSYAHVIYTKETVSPLAPESVVVTSNGQNDANPAVSWTGLSDSGSGLKNVQVGIADQSISVDNVTFIDSGSGVSAAGSCILNTVGLSDGTYKVWIRGVDNAGNVGAADYGLYYKNGIGLSVISDANLATLLRWDADTVTGTTYKVLRRASTNDTKIEVASGLTDTYWYDNNIVAGQTYYYTVEAIEPDNTTPIDSLEVSGTCATSGELSAGIGDKPLGIYIGMDMSSSNGKINAISGNLYYHYADFTQNLPGMALSQTYNSQADYRTSLGLGWDFSYNMKLIKVFDNQGIETGMILKEGDGTLYMFTKNQDGTYSCGKGEYLKLAVNAGIYTVTTKTQTQYEFDSFLRLNTITDINGFVITLTYDNRGNLHYVTNDVGDSIAFTYTPSTISGQPDKLATVTDASGRVYNFEYNDAGQFVGSYILYSGSVKYGEKYSYGSNGMISTITSPGGKLNTVVYDNDKVWKIRNPISSEDPNNTSETMVITYANGETSSTYRHAVNTYHYDSIGLLTSETDPLGVTTSHTYDNSTWDMLSASFNNTVFDSATGSISTTAVTDQYTYDSQGNILTHTRPDGKVEYFTYNPDNQITSEAMPFNMDSQGSVIYTFKTYSYNTDKKLINESGLTKCTRSTNGSFLPISGAHEEGTIMTYEYYNSSNTTNAYEYGLLKSETDKGYDSTNNQTVAFGTTTYKYDSKRRLKETDYPDGTVTTEGYDTYPDQTTATTYGAIAWAKDGKGVATLYYYDILGRQIKVYYNSDNTYTLTTFSLDGSVKSTVTKKSSSGTDTTTNATTYKYDSLDRTLSQTDNGVTTNTQYSYDNGGNLTTTVTDADGVKSTTKEDKVGQEYYSEDSDGMSYAMYDNTGNTIASWNNAEALNETFYDKMGNVKETVDDPDHSTLLYDIPSNWGYSLSASPENQKTTSENDLAGNVTESTDTEGTITTNTYDAASRTTSEIVSNEASEVYTQNTYSYGVQNQYRYTKVTDGNGHVTEYWYDNIGRLHEVANPGDSGNPSRFMYYDYDANGNLLTLTRFDNTQVTYQYNASNQMTRKSYDGNNHYVTYDYTDNGDLKTMTQVISGQATVTNAYEYDDPMYNMTGEKRDGNYIAQYKYSGTGKLTEVTYPQGEHIKYSYDDKHGRITKVSDLNGLQLTIRDYNYKSNGKLNYLTDYRDFKHTNAGNYTKEYFTFNSSGMPTDIVYKDYNNKKLSPKEEYAETPEKKTGNITKEKITTNYGSQPLIVEKNYTYDKLGEMQSESTGTSTISYTYDKAGNRKTMENGTFIWRYSYNVFNQLTRIEKASISDYLYNTDTTFTYDARGNEKTKYCGGITTTYNYDKADRLVSVTSKPDGGQTTTVASYKYDGADMRIEQTAGGSTTKYYYFYKNLLYTKDASGNYIEQNIIEPFGGIICSKRFSGSYAGNYYFYRQDIRGSVTNIIDMNGTVVKGFTYDAYGKTTRTGDPNFICSAAYTGALYDKDTGLYYENTRYYDPSLGRFLNENSERGVKGGNLFNYSGNDPIGNINLAGFIYPGRYASYWGSLDSIIHDMIQYGLQLVGKVKYHLGSTLDPSLSAEQCIGKKVDCQGWVRYLFGKFLAGTRWLPKRGSYYIRCGARYQVDQCKQYGWLIKVANYSNTDWKDTLKPGDLVFYHTSSRCNDHWSQVTHVGIYMGDHKVLQSTETSAYHGVQVLTLEEYHPAKNDPLYTANGNNRNKYINFVGCLFMDRPFKPDMAY